MRTKKITVELELPEDIADAAAEVARVEPEFLSRVVMYGMTRRGIYRHLRAQAEAEELELSGSGTLI